MMLYVGIIVLVVLAVLIGAWVTIPAIISLIWYLGD